MRAVRIHRFGGPEVLAVEEVPEPSPAPGEVLVRVRAAGVNPVDTYKRAGAYAELPALPYTPGGDAGGVVVALGPSAAAEAHDTTDPSAAGAPAGGAPSAGGDPAWSPAPGDRVYTSGSLTGTYAELALCRAEDVHPLPEELTFAQGAAVGTPAVTAFRALFQRGRARPGETVLVHGGSGAVGLAAVQLGVAGDLTVLATAGSAEGRALVLEHGAAGAFDHHDPGHLDAVRELTGGHGVDLVVELLANANLGRDLPALAPRGRVVVVGSRGRVEIDPRDLMDREATIVAMRLPNARPEELAAAWAGVQAALESGRLRPVVGRELPLAAATEAHRQVIEGPALGKLVLVP
ncbi:MAG: NADPH:quinone reductase [Thermoleophilia bacterium]|jgi:NADPH2:quinone reductase|nr:NADPH:quinone reductase [Thermoleophilia bacterium]